MSLPNGTKIGRYEIQTAIGAGGMGQVYRAWDTKLDRTVAIKILPPELTSDRDRVARFIQEAKAASALNHPYIVSVFDIGEFELAEGVTVHYMAMDFVDGETLREKFGKASTEELLGWLTHIGEALQKAHEKGIVHRDLKPENIMVTRDGYAKLLDFGLAKLTEIHGPIASDEATAVMSPKTSSGVVLGTVGYMSPEQVEGRPVDTRSDVFSFGCILYEAVTGKRAFRGTSLIDTLHRIVHEAHEPISSVMPECPKALVDIVNRMLSKRVEDRPTSMSEVSATLRGARVAHSAVAVADVVPLKSPNPGAIRWAFVGLCLVLVVAVLGWFWTRRMPNSPRAAVSTSTASVHLVSEETHFGDVRATTISRDGRFLAVARKGGTIALRDRATGSETTLVERTTLEELPGFKPEVGTHIYRVNFDPGVKFLYFSFPGEAGPRTFRVPILGGQPQLVFNAHVDSFLTSSDEILFDPQESDGGSDTKLTVTDLAGQNQRLISEPICTDATRHSPRVFSPDGTLMAYPCWDEAHEKARIRIKRREGNDYLVDVPFEHGPIGTFAESLSWVGYDIFAAVGQAEGFDRLVRVAFPSGEVERLTNDDSSYFDVGAASDGTVVAVRALRARGELSRIRLSDGLESDFDGVLAAGHDVRTVRFLANGDLVYAARVGSAWRLVRLARRNGAPSFIGGEFPELKSLSVSGDGRLIAVNLNGEGVAVVDPDSGNRRRLLQGEAADPMVSQSGDKVFVWREPRGGAGYGVVSVDPTSGDLAKISFEQCCNSLALSPTGETIISFEGGERPSFVTCSLKNDMQCEESRITPAPLATSTSGAPGAVKYRGTVRMIDDRAFLDLPPSFVPEAMRVG